MLPVTAIDTPRYPVIRSLSQLANPTILTSLVVADCCDFTVGCYYPMQEIIQGVLEPGNLLPIRQAFQSLLGSVSTRRLMPWSRQGCRHDHRPRSPSAQTSTRHCPGRQCLRAVPSPLSSVRDPHDYEPGDQRHPIQTDPNCRVCGQIRRSPQHPKEMQ